MQADRFGNALVEQYAGLEGRDLIARVVKDHPGRVALLSSFGAESSVLLHMVSEVAPDTPVIFLDTEKLFPETIAYRDRLVDELGLTDLRILKPAPSDLAAFDTKGDLHKTDTDSCCFIRKTAPLDRALVGFDVVISGRKRFHGAARTSLSFVSLENDRLKVEPDRKSTV